MIRVTFNGTSSDPVVPVQELNIECFEGQQRRQQQGTEADLMWREWFVGVQPTADKQCLYMYLHTTNSLGHCGKLSKNGGKWGGGCTNDEKPSSQ